MATTPKFTVFTFDEFKTWLDGQHVNRVIKLVQNHHTYLPAYAQFKGDNHVTMLKGMESFHLTRGFAEIAQNLTTFPDGKIAICRSLDKIPAGIKGANQNGICIEHVGNFDIGADAMTAANADTIVKLNALLCRKFNLTPNTNSIVYHHWYDLNTGVRTNGTGSTKSCPGTNFFGGNTVAACEANFIPKVVAAYNGVDVPAAGVIDTKGLKHGIVNTSGLNVRAEGNPNGAKIKVLNQGTHVAIYEEKDGWYRIAATQQWVKATYVDEVSVAEPVH